jgi:hypothetical protein
MKPSETSSGKNGFIDYLLIEEGIDFPNTPPDITETAN